MALDNKTTQLLKKLKENVSLPEFLIAEGFYEDKNSNWGKSEVYKNGVYAISVSYDKGQWIGWDIKGNLTGPNKSGDIVQIYRELHNKSFREALNDLSSRYGKTMKEGKKIPKSQEKTQAYKEDDEEIKTRRWKKIEEDLSSMKLVTEYWHLEVERGIKRETLNSKRFFGKIYHSNNNIIFPHVFKTMGNWVPCGYEIKRKNYSRFSSGGIRGLWFSHTEKSDHTIVMCESAIDCLSWHDINDAPDGVAYLSVAGRISKTQIALLKHVILASRQHKPTPRKIVLAFDSDTAGRDFTRMVQDIAPDYQMTVDAAPPGYKDWNQYLTDTEE